MELSTTSPPEIVGIAMASKIGEMAGLQQAMLSEMQRFNEQMIRMNAEMDKKHEENVNLITQRHEENQKMHTDHKAEDATNFNKLFKWQHYMVAGAAVVGFIWAVFTQLLPILSKIRFEQ